MHVASLQHVLQCLEEKGFTINPLKCEWAVQETDWLGYWLTPAGLKPWKKCIQAILDMAPPRNHTELRSFIGAITYYREMYPHRSHVMAPLTALTGKKIFEWSPDCQKAFDSICAMLAHDVFIRYPDHNKAFHIYTDASDYQLGAVIMQENIPVVYFSCKLNPAQKNYTTMEKELLSIVETLKEYRTMLLGCKELHVHTDHKNLTYANLNSQRVLWWCLFLEEYSPHFHYVQGPDNVIADALSCLPLQEEEGAVPSQHNSGKHSVFHNRWVTDDIHSADASFGADTGAYQGDTELYQSYSEVFYDEELLDSYLNHPEITAAQPLPVDYVTIRQHQLQDAALLALPQTKPNLFQVQMFPTENPSIPLVCYATPTPRGSFRIRIPDMLVAHTVNWYHLVLNHLGISRLYDTIAMHMMHPNLKDYCEAAVRNCRPCQQGKVQHRHYGELPARDVSGNPWATINVDLIGPWPVTIHGQEFIFHALTVIDPVTNYCEIIRINNKSAQHVGLQLENSWLSHYPRPIRCVFDQGGEFIGQEFIRVL